MIKSGYLPLLASAVAASAITIFLRNILDYSLFANDVGAWGVFFTVFGVLYAIMLGFLLIESLEKFNGLSTLLDKELNELQDIRDALIYLDNPQSIEDEIERNLYVYGQSVLEKEWSELSNLRSQMSADTSNELYALMHAVHAIEPTNRSDEEVQSMIMQKTFNITTFRTQRINLSNQTLPPRLLTLILFMSIVLVAGFMLMAVENLFVQLLMVSSLTASVHLLYQVMRDLDNPFEGVWNIDKSGFEEFVNSKNE